MAVWIEIDLHSGVPIYVQIAAQVRRAIEAGSLRSRSGCRRCGGWQGSSR